MRDRRRPLGVPSGFKPIDGMPEHYLIRPREDLSSRIWLTFLQGNQSMIERAGDGGEVVDGMSLLEVSASADCFGLAIGLLLYHPTRQLEIRPDDVGDDREAGRMIHAELQASGYTDEQIAALGQAAFGLILDERAKTPTAAAVEARVENGSAPA